MDDPATSELRSRIERLECRHRRLRRCVLALVAMVAGLLVLAMTEPRRTPEPGTQSYEGRSVEKIVAAESFVVVDKDGALRAVLGLTPAGTPALELLDPARKPLVTLAAPAEGKTALTLNAHGRAVAVLGVDEDRPGVGIYEVDGKASASLGVAPDGALKLTMLDAEGKARAALGLLPDGSPGLGLVDASGKSSFKAP